ncbi:MAG: hypothetical protein ACP5MD_13975 [Verrucomicrobiia bacterium]
MLVPEPANPEISPERRDGRLDELAVKVSGLLGLTMDGFPAEIAVLG